MDPEQERLAQLATRVRVGEATEAEQEELELYAEEAPEKAAVALRVRQESLLGRGWLARYEKDRLVVSKGETWLSRAERKVGVILVGLGALTAFVLPPVAFALFAAGSIVLGWSVLRVAATTHEDPYGDVKE